MSNRNDFDFDDDPFGNDDDNFDSFDDDFDEGELDSFENLGDDDDMFADDEEEASGGGGPNRVFIILAVLMILIFLGGLGAIFFIATRPTGPTDTDITRTAIAEINGTRIANITETAVQAQVFVEETQTQDAVFIGQTQTQAALPTETPTLAPTDTPSPTLTPEVTNTPEGGVGQEDLAATFAAATETVLAATNQAQQQVTPISGPGTLSANDVLLTATALFLTLNPQTPGPGTEVAATVPAVTPSGFPTPSRPGQLPDTGLFDGFASGQGLGTAALVTFGLIGLIFVSRRLRK